MKRTVGITLILLLTLAVVAQQKKSNVAKTATKHTFTPGDMQWGPPPPFVPAGAQVAVVEGNPGGADGDYTIRVKMPDGYIIPPHFHPKRENVTVISGTVKLGMGDNFDESKAQPYATGSFMYLDPSMHHYAKMQGETEIQVHGQAPLDFTYIHPEDDPRNKK